MARDSNIIIGKDLQMSGMFVPKHITLKEFADRLWSLMAHRGWKQADLSRHTGINKGTISEWCRAKSMPSQENLAILAKTLGVTQEELLPNRVANKVSKDSDPTFSMTSAGRSGYVWLSVNQMVKTKTALAIGQMLDNDNTPSD